MILPALSVKQPWASMLTSGQVGGICVKDIETRTWMTRYRGPLVICSSLEPRGRGPVGQALGIRMLRACRSMTEADVPAACCAVYEHARSWVMGRHWPLTPFRVSGRLGLFTVSVPLTAFGLPEDYAEVQQALEWAQAHDLLKYVTGCTGSDRSG